MRAFGKTGNGSKVAFGQAQDFAYRIFFGIPYETISSPLSVQTRDEFCYYFSVELFRFFDMRQFKKWSIADKFVGRFINL